MREQMQLMGQQRQRKGRGTMAGGMMMGEGGTRMPGQDKPTGSMEMMEEKG
jgi:hypothetical protein